nr:MAG: hypothetical protein [Bacteriophage sp.]
MANEKRIFTIQINGITESTNALSDLTKQLDELEKKIKALEKSNVKINSSATGGGKGNKAQLTEEEKLQKQINKEIEKRAAMQTKEYQELLKQKQATKDIATEQKQISSGALAFDDTGAKEYTNTLAGMKAQLAALKAESQNFDLSGWTGEIDDLPDSVKKANEAIKQLSDRIKSFEQSQGTFSRGVGDYYNEFKRALADANKEIEKSGKTLQGLQQRQSALKGLINTTQLGTKEWEEYNKELEEVNKQLNSLGSGFRAEYIINPKVVITVNDLVLEFDDLGQSVSVLEDKLYQLRIEGKANTEEYQNIVNELQKVKQTIRETDDEIDALTSRTRGLDMVVGAFQGLTAAMQVGAGVAGLFGKSEEDLQKTLQKVTSLMSIAQGLQEIHNQLTQKGTLLNKAWQLSLAGAQKVINLFSKTQKAATASTVTNTSAIAANAAATTATATATTVATTATKVFTIAMKGLKLAIASTGIGLLVIALGELVSWLMKGSDVSEKFAKEMNSLPATLEGLALQSERSAKWLENLSKIGAASDIDKLTQAFKNLQIEEKEATKLISDFAKRLSETKTSELNVEVLYSLSTLVNKYDDIIAEGYKVENVNKAIVKSFLEWASTGEQGAGAIVDMYQRINALGVNWDEILKVDGFENSLNRLVEISQNVENVLFDLMGRIGDLQQQTIDDSTAAMKDGLNKQLKMIQTERERALKTLEITDVSKELLSDNSLETIAKAREAINKKYDRQELEARKSFAKEVANVEKSIQNNKISIMKEGLDKTIAQLELNRKSEIEAAKETGIKVGEQTKAINAKYDAEILKAKEDFYKRREEAFKQFALNYKNIANSFASAEYEEKVQDVNVSSQEKQGSLTFDTDATLNASVEAQKKYNDEIVKLKMEAINRLNELDKNRSIDTMFNDTRSENERYAERLKVIEDYHKQGLTSEAEYNKQLEEEKQQHTDMLIQIETNGQRAIVDIDKKYNQERQNALADSNANVIRSYNDYFNEIARLQDTSTSTYKLTGIIDYKSTKQNLEKVKNEYSNLLKQINLEYDKLQKQFDNKEISFNDFQEAKKELKDLEQAAKNAGKNVSQSMDELISVTIQSYTQMLGQGLQLIAEIWQTISDMRVAAIEAQIEDLEDEYSELEKAYQKQEELVQKHTDKVSDIENELKTARGDRRAYLIEQLNSERRAQIEALQEEENIERKKQQNEKKQEALDKKRQREQKKAAKAQAIISGALTIANALATAPFIPVGIAMGALATGLVAVQIAKINSTQYADGGLLNGKPHSQGGIPVGNTGIEVEGNEYVVNKKSTQANLPLIDYINSNRRKLTRDDLINFFDNGKQGLINKGIRTKFAEGGQLPEVGEIDVKSLINYEPEQDTRPIQVQVVDIINATDNVRQVQTMAGL